MIFKNETFDGVFFFIEVEFLEPANRVFFGRLISFSVFFSRRTVDDIDVVRVDFYVYGEVVLLEAVTGSFFSLRSTIAFFELFLNFGQFFQYVTRGGPQRWLEL